MAWAYIDPGTGQQVWTSLGPIIAILIACLSVALLPLRWMWGMLASLWRKCPRWGRASAVCAGVIGAAFGIMVLGMMIAGNETAGPAPTGRGKEVQMKCKRVLVIGMDGLDPNLLDAMMSAGELPNFARLKAQGTFSALQTTVPPESPVAWTAAATGCNPGQAGIFDFIGRQPETYLPDLKLLRSKKRSALSGADSGFIPASDQRAVWDILSERGIPVSVIRWPVTFPPTPINGRMLSGLGTPDICSTLGRYRFFTTAAIKSEDKAPDRVTQVRWEGDRISTELPGPEIMSLTGTKTSILLMSVERAAGMNSVKITLGKGTPVELAVGAWSEWQSISFPGGLSRACPAMVRMYLTSVEPEFNLYVSPPQIDPSAPAFAMTSPKEFSKELAGEIGPYATLGLPEDSQAVQHGRIPMAAYLELCNQITTEREKMLDRELQRFNEGALFFVFDTSDRIQHMFWAATDKSHPAYTVDLEKQYGDVIRSHYRRMDGVIAKALAAAEDGQTAIFVLSDHGFTSFSRAAHLNTWLIMNGFMSLKEAEKEGAPLLKSVDWSRTTGYAVGFCSVYINKSGRERDGIVSEEEYQNVREKIARELRLWRDPATGDPVVRSVYLREDVYRGRRLDEAPDLIVGYYPGYRASWQTSLGAVPGGETVVANEDSWAGDHLVDAPCVPGVLLSNQKIGEGNPRLSDLAPTILKCFGIQPAADVDGKALF